MTPMMQKWQSIKAQHSDCIVFFRLGDFYEMFFDDAKTASGVLGITLTARDCGMPERAPMCGVPHHAVSVYIKKLVEKGFKIAICEQMSAPNGKGMVEREVTKVITAGTYCDDGFLDANKNNFVAGVYTAGEIASVSWCDITTGEFYAINTTPAQLGDIIAMINPREIIDSNAHYAYAFNSAFALSSILKYFNITSAKIFDLENTDRIINSAGALLHYLTLTQKATLANITKISVMRNAQFMTIDATARENLELCHALRTPTQKKGSLLWVVDDTVTPMGAREMVKVVSAPLLNVDAINERLDAVECFVAHNVTLRHLRQDMAGMGDISRLCGKAAGNNMLPRDFLSVRESMEKLGKIKVEIDEFDAFFVKKLNKNITLLPDLCDIIARAIAQNPSSKTDDGGFIRDGFDKTLDEYRDAEKHGHDWLGKLEAAERDATGIKEMKIAYNRVSGYCFEVPLRKVESVPYRFTRKGTTMSVARYTNDQLKVIEEKILNAHENAITLELKILQDLRRVVIENISVIMENARSIAMIDVLQSFASVAISNDFVRPAMNNDGRIELHNARHGVVERLVGRSNFIANDCDLAKTTMLITGPNMAGKSTFMRMVAHIVIMAHIGSFVPADCANIALTDRVFTRIGASDSLLTGESTFMVEMNEVSNIVHNATSKSLILLDEVGRGTGTSDGEALAKAIINYITGKIGCNTMFATHFHELTDLARVNPGIKNFKVLTEQIDNQIVFLHKVAEGIEQNSFGIDVAKLAGLPDEIITNARRLLR